jgi:DNA-binding protein Fis
MPRLQEVEDFFISKALRITENNKTKAADLLGISRFALDRKLKKK